MLYVVYNPVARVGGSRAIWKEIKPRFDELEYELYTTKYEEHAIKIAREITTEHNGNITIIVIGGDGTLNEVINGIVDLSKVTIGYIPVGSGNDFAKGIDLDTNPFNATEKVLNPTNFKDMDIGYIKYGDDRKRRFAISSGYGFEATICHQANIKSKVKKILNKLKIGKLTYVTIAFKVLCNFRRFNIKLETDNGTLEIKKALFVAAMNMPYEGGGYQFRPDAAYNSHKLHFIVAHDLTYAKAFQVLIVAKKAKHLKHKDHIKIIDCNQATLTSNIKKDIHVDGQPIAARNRIEYGIEKNTLRVIV